METATKSKFLIQEMLTGEMRGVVIKVKAALMRAIISLACRYPEPTREGVLHPNTLRLIDIKDKFFEYENNSGRKALWEAAFTILIAEYEHDPYYHYRFDWMLEEIVNSGWKPRPMGHPNKYWKEPEPFGGGYLVKYATE